MEVFQQLLILMIAVWTAATVLTRIGLPTIMGELLIGVVLGPAVLGLVEPSEIIEILAQMGIFFLMLHTGVETEPREFLSAVKSSLGIAIVGGLVPFAAATGVALAFGLPIESAVFVGLVMTATAVVVTLKILRDLNLQHTRMARVIVASCVLDDLFTLVVFSFVLGFIQGGPMDLAVILTLTGKIFVFFTVTFLIGYFYYPLFRETFRSREGHGFTFVLVLALAGGLFAEAIGLHMIFGAYIAGLFFEEKVASPEVVRQVEDRLNGIAYSFLGPIFFISLGFHITFDALMGPQLWFMLGLTAAVGVGQIIGAGGMARLSGFNWTQSLTVGTGMCGRAEMAFILASVGFAQGIVDSTVFSALIFTTFLLTLLTPIALKACAVMLARQPTSAPSAD